MKKGQIINTAKLTNALEKGHYPFKHYPHTRCETVYFPGCSFPSQFPETNAAVSEFCRERGVGVVYDCCARSLVGYGMEASAERALSGLLARLQRIGCSRVITACPNCLEYLSRTTDLEVVSLVDYFVHERVAAQSTFAPGLLFIPCPDKQDRTLERALRAAYDLSAVKTMEKAGCCGLRPEIFSQGSEVSSRAGTRVIDAAGDKIIYTYCASCLGQFARLGYARCRHVVSIILGVDEAPDAQHALANRARCKFAAQVEPKAGMSGVGGKERS
ncbi:MAG: heterodisulfide reductase-related iron-sulfur binding cluster [Atopobiaceae bacterium]|jgi:fumarate reductase (CoM/CoB) subunit B